MRIDTHMQNKKEGLKLLFRLDKIRLPNFWSCSFSTYDLPASAKTTVLNQSRIDPWCLTYYELIKFILPSRFFSIGESCEGS